MNTTAAGSLPRIVVIGAGFGGLNFCQKIPSHRARITVIDRQNHHLFQPLLYQVAAAGLSAVDIAQAVRALFSARPNLTVLVSEVTGFDLEKRIVRHAHGELHTISLWWRREVGRATLGTRIGNNSRRGEKRWTMRCWHSSRRSCRKAHCSNCRRSASRCKPACGWNPFERVNWSRTARPSARTISSGVPAWRVRLSRNNSALSWIAGAGEIAAGPERAGAPGGVCARRDGFARGCRGSARARRGARRAADGRTRGEVGAARTRRRGIRPGGRDVRRLPTSTKARSRPSGARRRWGKSKA